MRAGHVLCEKPMASNATEAYRMQTVAEEESKVLMVFHWRYHPLAQRVELLEETIGDVSELAILYSTAVSKRYRYNPVWVVALWRILDATNSILRRRW